MVLFTTVNIFAERKQ